MKRIIKASTNSPLLTSKYFDLVETHGRSVYGYEWEGLKVISKGAAEKHVVEIRLDSSNYMGKDIEGDVFTYEYDNANIAHGMRSSVDTLEETEEYIKVLQEAVDFVHRILKFLNAW